MSLLRATGLLRQIGRASTSATSQLLLAPPKPTRFRYDVKKNKGMQPCGRGCLRFAIACCAVVLFTQMHPRRCAAHQVLPSAIELKFLPGAIDGMLLLPVGELGLALKTSWSDPSLENLHEAKARFDGAMALRLRDYVTEHLKLEDERAIAWRMTVDRPQWVTKEAAPFIRIPVHFTATDNHIPESLALTDEVISEEVVSHRTVVSVAQDFGRADFDDELRVATILSAFRRTVTFDRSNASFFRGIRAMATMGVKHIAEGLDHLLFVLVLLLAAPLRPEYRTCDGRPRLVWGECQPARATMRSLATIVTAFTLGHSLTLALGALDVLRLPEKPVEVAIGLSIALGALNAVRPMFAGWEAVVSSIFGLVHGLAFATTLTSLGLQGGALIWSLFAFNLGIELVQIMVVLSIAPLLIGAAYGSGYTCLRYMLAFASLVAAGAWLLQRLLDRPNWLSTWLQRGAEHPLRTWCAFLTVLSLWALWAHFSVARGRNKRTARGPVAR